MAKYEYKQYWTPYYISQKPGIYIPQILHVLEQFNPHTILELGSGMGHTSKVIKEKFNCHLTGIDITKGNEYLDEYINADLSQFDTDEKYDLILAQSVLLHIKPEHIHSLLNKMHKWSQNIIVLDYDPEIEIPLDDHNFHHDFTMFPVKIRISQYNSIWHT